MKKLFTIAVVLLFATSIFLNAQEETEVAEKPWKIGGDASLTLGQTAS